MLRGRRGGREEAGCEWGSPAQELGTNSLLGQASLVLVRVSHAAEARRRSGPCGREGG